MKRSLIITVFAIMAGLTSCLKGEPFLDVSHTQPVVEFAQGTLRGNLSSWGAFPDTTVVDTAIAVDIASPQPLNYDVTVTIGFDTGVIAAWNTANPNNTLQMLPDSTFKLSTTTVTIPAGYRIGRIPLKFYKNKIDPTVSYGMPFVVKSTTQSGAAPVISSNAGTLFYGIIGNVLGGNYSWDFTRFNSADTTGTPNGSSFTGHIVAPKVTSPLTLIFPDSYIQTFVDPAGGPTLTFDFDTNHLPADFSASFEDALTKEITDGGFTILQTPVLVGYKIVGSTSTKYAGSTFRFYTVLKNSSGGIRTVIDNFVKQ